MKTKNIIYRNMSKVGIVALLYLFFISNSYAQTTVYVPASSTGRVSDSPTKSTGHIEVGNSDAWRGWARFNLASIPSDATITDVKIHFYVYQRTFSSQSSNRLRVFTTDPASRSASLLRGDILASSSSNQHETSSGTYANDSWNIIGINATGRGIVQGQIGAFVNVGFYRHTYNGTYRMREAGHANEPLLAITYTTPCDPQTVDVGGAVSAICQGGTTAGLGGSVGGSATTGEWSSSAGGSFSPNATTLNATWSPPAEYSGTATLTLITTNGCSSHVSDNKTVVVNTVPTGVTANA